MFGWMTEREANKVGMTHHGSYYGIPLYMNDDQDIPTIYGKHVLYDYLIILATMFEDIIRVTMFPEDEPGFLIRRGKKINPAPTE